MCVDMTLTKLRPFVVADAWIVRSKRDDVFDFLRPHFSVRGRFGLPNDLPADRHIATLLWGKVRFDNLAVWRAKVPHTSREIHANVNLAVGERELINPFHDVRSIPSQFNG